LPMPTRQVELCSIGQIKPTESMWARCHSSLATKKACKISSP
jgi:hypothetical protein